MDQTEELKQIATWLSEEGLAPDAPKEAQLCLLWRALQHTRSRLSSVTRELETHRSQHLAEMAEVRKSLEQIRIFTGHKDVLAQEIQDENDQLKDQLRRLISLQDAQISEVAKMLYQQGLTELIHSSPSEQVAYLLVERASLLETSEDPGKMTSDGNTTSLPGKEAQPLTTGAHQSTHKGAPRHGQSTWKRLLGLHKASQNKHTFIPAEARHLTDQPSGLERECSRLERDLEEGSRRLAMAHNEIRRLTDELDSAHLTQRAYEPELQSAQQEVEQLRHEVEKLKKYEIVELRKVKELNDGLDLEIRTLRSRVRSVDAEKNSLQQTVFSLQEEVKHLESALQEQQQKHLSEQSQANQAEEKVKVHITERYACLDDSLPMKPPKAELAQNNQTWRHLQEKLYIQTRHLMQRNITVEFLQKEVEQLKSSLQEQQQQLISVQVQADRANELAESREAELIESNRTCKDLQNKVHSLQQQLDNSHNDVANLRAKVCIKENSLQDQRLWKQLQADSQLWETTHSLLEDSFKIEDKEPQTQLHKENAVHKECPDYQEAMRAQLSTQDECETLKEEICETLKCLDREQSKYHEMKERHKAKLCRAKQKLADVTAGYDERINKLERELSLCSHSLAKEKELVRSMNGENEKLLCERRRLLQQLSEEEHSKKDSNLSALLSKRRVEFLEVENNKLGTKIFHMSNQLGVLQRSLQNLQSLHFAEELKKMFSHQQVSLQTSSVISPELPPPQGSSGGADCSQTKRTHGTSSPLCSRLAEMGYMNLTTQSRPDQPAAPPVLSNPESLLS